MLPNSRIFKTSFISAAILLTTLVPTRADFLDDINHIFLFGNADQTFRVRLTGLLDVESYYLGQPADGLIDSEKHFLFNPRLTIFVDANWTHHFYASAQVRFDRGFDPSDEGAQARLDEYFLRYTPLSDSSINLQVGKFATVVGNWVPRHYSWDNPFINAPLPYENLLGVWDVAAPPDVDTLLGWGHVGAYNNNDYSDKYRRLPVIWGPSYASGFSVFGTLNQFDYAAELKNASLSSRPEAWDVTARGFDNPTFSGRLGFRPNEMFNFGLSGSTGAYLLESATSTLPAGASLGDYREILLGQDASFAWHHLQLFAECFETRFQIPRIGNADNVAYYFEAKYKFTPQLFAALRWNQQLFGTIRDEEDQTAWGNDTWRIDAAVGYRFTDYLQAKLQYSFTGTPNHSLGENLVATQITFKF